MKARKVTIVKEKMKARKLTLLRKEGLKSEGEKSYNCYGKQA